VLLSLQREVVQTESKTTALDAEMPSYETLRPLGAPGKDKTVYEARAVGGSERVALARYHKGKGRTVRTEAANQALAAAAGLAPQVVDVAAGQLVSKLLSGGTLLELAQQQGKLTADQQWRIVELLTQLGAPEQEGGAGLRHGDAGNPANYAADASGTLFMLDFAPPHVKGIGKQHPLANLNSLGSLLWDPGKGLLRRGFLTEPPLVLLREFRKYRRDVVGAADARDPDPMSIPPATARPSPRARPSPAAASGGRRRKQSSPPRQDEALDVADELPEPPRPNRPGPLAAVLCLTAATLVGGLGAVLAAFASAHRARGEVVGA